MNYDSIEFVNFSIYHFHVRICKKNKYLLSFFLFLGSPFGPTEGSCLVITVAAEFAAQLYKAIPLWLGLYGCTTPDITKFVFALNIVMEICIKRINNGRGWTKKDIFALTENVAFAPFICWKNTRNQTTIQRG